MFSFPEILVILLVAVMVLGPKKLPEMARKLGHWMGIFKRASEEFKRELMNMDRAVDDTLNRAVSEVDKLVPEDEEVVTLTDVEAEIGGALEDAFAPPTLTPDDALEMPPVAGGLPSEPTPPEASPTPSQTDVAVENAVPSAETVSENVTENREGNV